MLIYQSLNSFIFFFEKVNNEEHSTSKNCTFPTWATSLGLLESLTYTSHYEFSQDGSSFTLSNYSYIKGYSHQVDLFKFQLFFQLNMSTPIFPSATFTKHS